MADHLFDEGRHGQFWTRLVRLYWQAASPADRDSIAPVLPIFLAHYLTNELQKSFDLQLIDQLDVSADVRHALRADMGALVVPHHPPPPADRQHHGLSATQRFAADTQRGPGTGRLSAGGRESGMRRLTIGWLGISRALDAVRWSWNSMVIGLGMTLPTW